MIVTWVMGEDGATPDTAALHTLGHGHGDHPPPVAPVVVEAVAGHEAQEQVEDGHDGTELYCVAQGPIRYADVNIMQDYLLIISPVQYNAICNIQSLVDMSLTLWDIWRIK